MRFWKLIIRTWLGMALAMIFGMAPDVLALTQDSLSDVKYPATEAMVSGIESYTVRQSDTLYAIAKRFNTTVLALQSLNSLEDSRLVYEGDTVLVPHLDETRVRTYVVEAGDSLFRISQRFDTTVEALQSLNGISDRNHIILGQTILLPQSAGSTYRPAFAYGITLFPDLENTPDIVSRVNQLGVNWAKIEVSWADIEPAESNYAFDALDALIAGLDAHGIQILLNIYAAPPWSRRAYTSHFNSLLRANSGPPEDPNAYGNFMRVVAERYAGLVDAYEIWKAPNILKYWMAPIFERKPTRGDDGEYGFPDKIQLGADHYVVLLKSAYKAINSVDSDALVITAGLAPVGFTDNYNSVATGTFLQNMLHEGATDYSDGIGALFGASAVPPTLFCCEQPPGVDTHYESYLQYFREILYLYHDVLTRNGAADVPIYVTQVGWGTTEGSNLAIPASGLEWLGYTDQDEQALYVRQAYDLARGLRYIEGMFLYNLNGCAVSDNEACFFSLYDADTVARPAYESFAEIDKPASES